MQKNCFYNYPDLLNTYLLFSLHSTIYAPSIQITAPRIEIQRFKRFSTVFYRIGSCPSNKEFWWNEVSFFLLAFLFARNFKFARSIFGLGRGHSVCFKGKGKPRALWKTHLLPSSPVERRCLKSPTQGWSILLPLRLEERRRDGAHYPSFQRTLSCKTAVPPTEIHHSTYFPHTTSSFFTLFTLDIKYDHSTLDDDQLPSSHLRPTPKPHADTTPHHPPL